MAHDRLNSDKHKFWLILFAIIAAGLALRLVLAYTFYGTQDVDAWEQFSTYWERHKSPYDQSLRFNYGPPWFWIISSVEYFRRFLNIPFSTAIKFPMILADLLTLFILLKGCRLLKKNQPQTLVSSAIFFLNPVSIFSSGYHGQFDNIGTLFSLTAWYLYEMRQKWSFAFATFSFMVAVAVKHFNILLTPVFIFSQGKLVKKVLVMILAPSLFLLLIAPYWMADTQWVNQAVFKYNLHSGYWGWVGVICRTTLLFTDIDLIKSAWFYWTDYFNYLLYFGIFIASYFLVRKYSLLDSIIITFLIFYTFTTQMAPQYTVWIIPFAVLRPNRYLYAYSVIGGAQLPLFYYSHYHWVYHYPLSHIYSEGFVIFRYLTWIVCLFWLFHMLRLKFAR